MPEEKKEEKTNEEPTEDKNEEETAEEPAEESASTDATADEEEEEVEVPEKFKDIVSTIEEMSVLDLSELVKVLEDTFGVSAAQPMMMAGGGAAAGAGEGEGEEQTAFNVEISAVGDQKINVIKVIREVTELSLKDAKGMVDDAPSVIREGVDKEQAEEIKKKLEDAGATVALK